MTSIQTLNHPRVTRWNAGQLDLMRTTIASRLTNRMFDMFIETADKLNLDPLKKQIVPIVFRKRELDAKTNKWEWTPNLTLITTIDGYRAIADRTGNYRPDEEPPRFVIDEALQDPATNPIGIVSCQVSVFKWAHGSWHRHTAEVFWDEYVPLKLIDSKPSNDGLPDDANPDTRPKRQIIDPGTQWGRRPRGQIAKCAEALALRRGWPEDLSNLYVEEEMDQAKIIDGEWQDLTPSEKAEAAATDRRLEAVQGKNSLLIDWMTGELVQVPLGQVADKCIAFIREHHDEPTQLAGFQERNRYQLREFWARSPSDALEVKKAFQNAIDQARKGAVMAETDDAQQGEA